MGLLAAAVLFVIYVAALDSGRALGAELQERTIRAYEAYLDRVNREFIARVPDEPLADRRTGGVISVKPGEGDGIINVEGGLVHHWAATAFLRGLGLRDVVRQSRAFESYSSVYKAVVASQVLEHEGDRYRVLMRIKEGAAGISAVLQVRSTVRYLHPTSGSVLVISSADEIQEVKNAGDRDERLLPAGRDRGYLWRASTFTRYVEHPDGVWVEMETLGLSRRFPPLLGWLIEPIARRLGRRSVEGTLREFEAAVRGTA